MEKEEKPKVDGAIFMLAVGLGVTALLWYLLKDVQSADAPFIDKRDLKAYKPLVDRRNLSYFKS
ncbi:MAG: hypothetical protein IPJ01_11030 [Micavibrio sp.]|nr:hypothetical protein [Micavibrio sp.]